MYKEIAKVLFVSVVIPVAGQIAQQIAEQWLEKEMQKSRKHRWVFKI